MPQIIKCIPASNVSLFLAFMIALCIRAFHNDIEYLALRLTVEQIYLREKLRKVGLYGKNKIEKGGDVREKQNWERWGCTGKTKLGRWGCTGKTKV